MQGAGYAVGSRFARGGIRTAAVTQVCVGLTADVYYYYIIYSVASTTSASINDRSEHELKTNRRNDEQERRLERLH